MISRRGLLALPALALLPLAARAQTMTPVAEFDWRYLADTVMGGVSEGQAQVDGDAIRLTGTVSTANNGGFIQVRTDLPNGAPEGATALRLRVRGNGQRYFIHLRTRATRLPWQYYQAGFDTTADWQDITLPLSAFRPSGAMLPRSIRPERIRSLGLVAYGRDHQADVRLSALGWVS